MKSILLSMLAIATLASCNKDENLVASTGEETYAGISVAFPKLATRAVTADENATTEEQAVESLGVYVVGADGTLHSKVFPKAEFEEGAGNYYQLKAALKTTTGDKNIFVVLNPTAEVSAAIGAKRTVAFGENEYQLTADKFMTTTSMVMSSTKAKSVTLEVQDNSTALAQPIHVSVQRNLAKVAVLSKNGSSGTFTTSAGHTVKGLEFASITLAKNSYLIQQLNVAGDPISLANIKTPGMSYVFPPGPSPIANDYWNTVVAPTVYDDVMEAPATAAPKSYNAFYALENINTKNVVGNTTAAIIKANVTLKSGVVVTAYDTTTGSRDIGTLAEGNTFYVKLSDNTVWSEAGYNNAVVAGGAYSLTAADFSKPYVGGVSYYRIWVKDSNSAIGIIRNNYYIMQINNITGIGLPEVPGTVVDPETPVEDDTYIAVTVEVLAWNIENSEHNL